MDNLIKKIIEMQNVTCAGLDTAFEYLPESLKKSCATLSDAARAITEFNISMIEALKDIVPSVKVQIAYYEMYGASGLKAFYDTVRYAKEQGMIVIADAKRNDIGSTADCYNKAFLGQTTVNANSYEAYPADMLTVNGYLGTDGIAPFVKSCETRGKGIFVLVKTSNPSSGELQDMTLSDGRTVYEAMGDMVEEWGKTTVGEYGYSSVGAVVGATHREQAEILRKRLKNTFFLIPGYGAQGGAADDLAVCFDERGLGGVVNSSRGIICANKLEQYKGMDCYEAARQAAIDMKEDILAAFRRKGIEKIG